MKALCLMVHKLWQRLKFLKSRSVGQTSRSRSLSKNYGMMWKSKVLSQGMHICNMKAIAFLVWKLWPRLKFLKSRSNFKVKVTRSKNYGMMWKVLSQGIHLWNMKVLSFAVHKLWPRLKFLSTDDENNNDDNNAGAMAIVLRTFVTAN